MNARPGSSLDHTKTCKTVGMCCYYDWCDYLVCTMSVTDLGVKTLFSLKGATKIRAN